MWKFTLTRKFLLPLLLVSILAIFSASFYLLAQNMEAIEKRAYFETNKLANVLQMAKSLVGERVVSSMSLLKQSSLARGKPSINGVITLKQETIPNLTFGHEPQTEQTALVDGVTSIGSGTATIFVKNHNAFIRIATNVRLENNARAIGTRLDPNGKAISHLLNGKPFYGVVDILGQPYISGYDPITNDKGEIIGAWYVGYKVDMRALDQAIKKWTFLKTGFAAITDYNQDIRFLSDHTTMSQARITLGNIDKQWLIAEREIPDWNFHAYIAYPLREAYLSSAGQLYPLLVLGGIFGIALLVIAQFGIKRFVLTPLGGDPETASRLVRSIEQGNFSEDSTTAAPDTLIGNMLKMRTRIREMISEINENSDRLKISSSVFQHAHDGIFITDSGAKIIDVNPAFTIITGYSYEEAIGKDPEALGFAYQIDAFFSEFFESTNHQGEWRGDVWNRHKNNKIYVASLDIFPVHNAAGEFQHYVGLFSDITNAKEQQISLEHMAYHDSLTQLPNRFSFSNHLQKMIVHADRTKEAIAICYIDLDDFKPINDQFGHEIGDRLLVLLSERLRKSSRIHDTVARIGGDEFAMLLSGFHTTENYTQALDRLLQAIEESFYIDNQVFNLSASIGYTIYPDDNSPPDILLRHADHAMYHAKTHGGRHYHLFDLDLAQSSQLQQQLKQDIAEALRTNQLVLLYQPLINIKTGDTIGMEALIRWQHPTRGFLQPLEFLSLIEHTYLISELGEWVIMNVLSQIEKWQQQGLDFFVGVNIAAYHLTNKSFFKNLSAAFERFPNVSGRRLNLEITESAAINDIANVTEIIRQCKQLGVTFSIDDFGSGYSSLIYLRRLPVDTIKIDRSFIDGMLTDPEDLAVVTGIITLCREFKRNVIAEGVESRQQSEKLAELGCLFAQGFGISKPMEAGQVADWIKANSPFIH